MGVLVELGVVSVGFGDIFMLFCSDVDECLNVVKIGVVVWFFVWWFFGMRLFLGCCMNFLLLVMGIV